MLFLTLNLLVFYWLRTIYMIDDRYEEKTLTDVDHIIKYKRYHMVVFFSKIALTKIMTSKFFTKLIKIKCSWF